MESEKEAFDTGDCPEWVSDISLMKWQRYTSSLYKP